jgi:hypothetical protein
VLLRIGKQLSPASTCSQCSRVRKLVVLAQVRVQPDQQANEGYSSKNSANDAVAGRSGKRPAAAVASGSTIARLEGHSLREGCHGGDKDKTQINKSDHFEVWGLWLISWYRDSEVSGFRCSRKICVTFTM